MINRILVPSIEVFKNVVVAAGKRRVLFAGAFTFARLLRMTESAEIQVRFSRNSALGGHAAGESAACVPGAEPFDVLEVENIGAVDAVMTWKVTQNVITSDDRTTFDSTAVALPVSPYSLAGPLSSYGLIAAGDSLVVVAAITNINGLEVVDGWIACGSAPTTAGHWAIVGSSRTENVILANYGSAASNNSKTQLPGPRRLPPGVPLMAYAGVADAAGFWLSYRIL